MSTSKKRTLNGRKYSTEPNFVMWCHGGDHSTCGRADLPSDFEEAQRGAEDGTAWASEGRSYAAVEAVYTFHTRVYPKGATERQKNIIYHAAKANMFEAIGYDDEDFFGEGKIGEVFDAGENEGYVYAWLDAVCIYFEEEMAEEAA